MNEENESFEPDEWVTCSECKWCGQGDEIADDGPSHEWCCPLCGSDDLEGESF